MSDGLVKRYRLDGQYDLWGMVDAESGEYCSDDTEIEWVNADDHAAALVAKDAEIARLRGIMSETAASLVVSCAAINKAADDFQDKGGNAGLSIFLRAMAGLMECAHLRLRKRDETP